MKRFSVIIVIFFLILSLFRHWEPSGETWGYWAFSRILAETGRFIISDRSPAYVTYLLLFQWLPFPVSVATEYFVSTGIVITSLIIFFRPLLGLSMAIFAVILWIPFLQVAEPPPQKLALALSLFAVMLRNKRPSSFHISTSYALLILCYLLRSTYQFLFLIFLLWDVYRAIHYLRHHSYSHWKEWVSTRSIWPLLVVLGFYLLVLFRQSPHPWNTVYFSTGTWFLRDAKRFSILEIYNARYAYETYGSVKDTDFSVTNQEVFRGAKNDWEALLSNPVFILRTLSHYFVGGIYEALRLTSIFSIVGDSSDQYRLYIHAILFMLLGVVFYGAISGAKTSNVRLFVIGNIFLACLSMIVQPHWRYMPPLIPVFLLAVVRYAKRMGGLTYLHRSSTVKTRILTWCFTACFIIALCSSE